MANEPMFELGPLYLRNFAVPPPPMRDPPTVPSSSELASDRRDRPKAMALHSMSSMPSKSRIRSSASMSSRSALFGVSSALFGGNVTAEEAPRLHVSMAAMFPSAEEEKEQAMARKAKGLSPWQSEESAESPPIMLSLSSLY